MSGSPWTKQETILVQELRAKDLTCRIIAESLPGRTEPAVRRYLGYIQTRQPQLEYSEVVALQSGDLLRALAVSFTRFANDNAISMTEAMNRLLYAGEAR